MCNKIGLLLLLKIIVESGEVDNKCADMYTLLCHYSLRSLASYIFSTKSGLCYTRACLWRLLDLGD